MDSFIRKTSFTVSILYQLNIRWIFNNYFGINIYWDKKLNLRKPREAKSIFKNLYPFVPNYIYELQKSFNDNKNKYFPMYWLVWKLIKTHVIHSTNLNSLSNRKNSFIVWGKSPWGRKFDNSKSNFDHICLKSVYLFIKGIHCSHTKWYSSWT